MPRAPRVLIEGGLYHLYNRFASAEEVFADPEEAIRGRRSEARELFTEDSGGGGSGAGGAGRQVEG